MCNGSPHTCAVCALCVDFRKGFWFFNFERGVRRYCYTHISRIFNVHVCHMCMLYVYNRCNATHITRCLCGQHARPGQTISTLDTSVPLRIITKLLFISINKKFDQFSMGWNKLLYCHRFSSYACIKLSYVTAIEFKLYWKWKFTIKNIVRVTHITMHQCTPCVFC